MTGTPSDSDAPAEPRNAPLRVLWLTTKYPWPATDGGRLLVSQTIEALDREAVQVVLAGPWDQSQTDTAPACAPAIDFAVALSPAVPKFRLATIGGALGLGQPLTAQNHHYPAAKQQVAQLFEDHDIDVVHLEQPHAKGLLPPTQKPALLRAQNVESDLWTRYANAASFPLRTWLRRQARAVERWEVGAARSVQHVAAISDEDRRRFVDLGVPESRVSTLAPAFPDQLPVSDNSFSGAPAVVLFSGSSWRPNRLGEDAFLQQHWPLMAAANPKARLHVFGSPRPKSSREVVHASHYPFPERAVDAFAAGTILIVPALVTSGVRMKILEAWARGVAVLTTPAGARGLSPKAKQVVAIANTSAEWAAQLEKLADPAERRNQVDMGRRLLKQENAPALVARHLAAMYSALQKPRP